MDNIQKGALGFKIILDCVVDISSASVRKIKYKKPDDTTGEWTASEEAATEISYTTTSTSDIDQAGRWVLQSYVEKGAWKISGKKVRVEVLDNIVVT